MKNILFRIVASIVLLFSVAVCAAPLMADTNAVVVTADASISAGADTSGAVAATLIQQFAGTHPWIASILAIMAVARAFAKPTFSLIESSLGPDNAFAKKMASAESGSIYKGFAWLLDFLFSIKVHLIAPTKP